MASSRNNKYLTNIKENNENNKESEIAILSILEKSYCSNVSEENFEIPSKLLKGEKIKNDKNNNITLFNALYNSLINKDHKSFLFCIQQNNEILIEETVKQMNSDCLSKFIEKSIDIFQSNSFYTKNIIPWFKKIIKFKKINILKKNNIENLVKIQMYISDKIKCLNNLCILKQKMNKINAIFSPISKEKSEIFLKKKKNEEEKNIDNKPVIFEPLLTYFESEDEDEKKEKEIKKNKMEIEGFEELDKENNEEVGELEEENDKESSDEDDFDEEIDNMEIEENDKIKKKNNIELDGEEEENEDDNE